MGSEGGCNRAGHFHCRAVWHCRVTPKSIEQPQSPSAHVQTEFRNETRNNLEGPISNILELAASTPRKRGFDSSKRDELWIFALNVKHGIRVENLGRKPVSASRQGGMLSCGELHLI